MKQHREVLPTHPKAGVTRCDQTWPNVTRVQLFRFQCLFSLKKKTHVVGHLLHPVDDSDVVEPVNAGAESPVQAEHLASHQGCQRKEVKEVLGGSQSAG